MKISSPGRCESLDTGKPTALPFPGSSVGLCVYDPHYFPLLLSIDKWTPNHICSDTSDSRDHTLFSSQPPERTLTCILSDLGPPSLSCQKELRQELINLRLPSTEALQSPEAPHQLCNHRTKYQPV